MKRISLLILSLIVGAALNGRAQDAATEERLNQLSGKIENLVENYESQRKQIAELAREIERLRERVDRPAPNYASQDELRRLAESLRDVDRKRIEDYERIAKELKSLGKSLAAPLPTPSRKSAASASDSTGPEKSGKPETGFEYVVQKKDTLSTIVQAVYREKNVRVTVEQVLKANPGLKPDKLVPGKKIFIPAPQS